nr:unnamed protein product [Callosobruchus chinensis]
MVRLPTAKKQKKGRYNHRLWITVKWPVPNKMHCSSRNNELVQLTIPKCGGDGLKVIHNDHSGSLFSIVSSIQDFVKKDWKIPEHLVAHICYRIDGEEAEVEKLAMYLTFAGVSECSARNKVNPYRLRNTRVCYRCTKSTSTYETEGILNLSMRSLELCRLEELMHDYLCDYLVSDFSCQECNSTMTIVNKRRVVVEPEVLVIALKRYICNEDGTIKKHEGQVMFPDDGLQFGRSVYKLYTVAQHEGAVSAGHYYAACLLDALGTTGSSLMIQR